MLYTEKQKQEMEKILEVFQDYLKESPYADIVWSDKLGYIWLCISLKKRTIEMEPEAIDDPEELCEILFKEVAQDVLELTKNEHSIEESDLLEQAEIRKRLSVYLQKLPQYCNIAEEIFVKQKE